MTNPEQRAAATRLRRLMAAYRDVKELIEIGAYAPGSDADVDAAVRLRPAIDALLQQDLDTPTRLEDAWRQLSELVA